MTHAKDWLWMFYLDPEIMKLKTCSFLFFSSMKQEPNQKIIKQNMNPKDVKSFPTPFKNVDAFKSQENKCTCESKHRP